MSIPTFTLTVDGTPYTAAQRAAAGIHMGDLEMFLEMAYDTLSFTEVGPAADPLFHPGLHVTLTRDSDSLVCFEGEITDLQWAVIPKGIGKAYSCLGLSYIGDRVPVTWTDGTGQAIFNRPPNDPYYLPSYAGMTIGAMIEAMLTVPFTATLLDSFGIGQYTTLSPPTLPATTLADLAAMNVVPASQIVFQGESLLNQIKQLIPSWMPRFVMQLRPDGLLRFKDTTDVGALATFIPRTLTLPGTTGQGDAGIQWPSISSSTRECSTSCVMRGGPETEATWLTLLDGTIAEGWSGGDESAWTLFDFTQPKDAYDEGTITAITSTSATVQSDDPGVFWAMNFWNDREANIFMTDLVASGIDINENRLVTSTAALVAGGTAVIGWDASWPITMTTYTRYRLVGTSGGLNEVGRLYYVRDPSTGFTGLNTYIGSRIVVRSAYAVRVANNDKTFAEFYGSTATVCNSSSGSPPFVEIPAIVEPVPALGAYRFTAPTARSFTSDADLEVGYPATSADGRPSEIRILAMYSRGALSNQAPGSGFSGTAYTDYGLEVTKYTDFPDWLWKQDSTSFGTLANEYLLSVQDIVWEGSVSIYEFPAAFDVLIFENAINFALNGGTSPWTAMNAPQRSVRVGWGNGAPAVFNIDLTFSSRRRPFSAESLYIHPQFAPGSALTNATTAISEALGGANIHVSGPGFTQPMFGPGSAINSGPSLALGQQQAQVGMANSTANQMANLQGAGPASMVGLSQGVQNTMTGGYPGTTQGGDLSGLVGGGSNIPGIPSTPRQKADQRRRTAGRDQRRRTAGRDRMAGPMAGREMDTWKKSFSEMETFADYPNPFSAQEPDAPAVKPKQLEAADRRERAQRKPLFVGPRVPIHRRSSPPEKIDMAPIVQRRPIVPSPDQTPSGEQPGDVGGE
jgi:hypothetical protein